jgi:signal transduction histidine kinase
VLAEEKNQELTVELPGPVAVECDATVLRQGITNLLHNAIKFTPPKGIIRVAARSTVDGGVVIEVEDSGPGIPAADHQRVFERFYRVDQARSRDTGGTGLGLAIARWAVEASGGRIELESVAGRGTLFRVVLPRS